MFDWINNGLKAVNAWMDASRTKEDQLAGANKVKVAQHEKEDEIRKGADRIKSKSRRNRMLRNKPKGK